MTMPSDEVTVPGSTVETTAPSLPTQIRSEVIVLADMSPALRQAAVSFAVIQQAKIDRLRSEIASIGEDSKRSGELADALAATKTTPNRVRSLRSRVRVNERQVQQLERAVMAMENGFIPIPHLDNTRYGDWRIREVPYRILKAIKERGLERLFDEIGIVEPQDGTGQLRQMEFTVRHGDRDVTSKVFGRITDENVYIHHKDPMLVGTLGLPGGKFQMFMLTVWNDNLERFG